MSNNKVPLLDRALLFFIEYLLYFLPILIIYNYGLIKGTFHFNERVMLIVPFIISFILEVILKKSWIKNMYRAKLINIDDTKEVTFKQHFLRFLLKPFAVLQGYLTVGIVSGTLGIILFVVKRLERSIINFFKRKSTDIFYDEITGTKIVFKESNYKGNVGVLLLIFLVLFVLLFFIP